MPKAPKCACGTCRLCKARESNRRIYAGDERMPWPADWSTLKLRSCYGQYFGESAKVTKAPHYSPQE